MTIKITQVSMSSGEVLLTVTYDNPKDSGIMFSFKMRKQDFWDNLIQIYTLLGRPLTSTDMQQTFVALINKMRLGQLGMPGDFDFVPYIGVNLE